MKAHAVDLGLALVLGVQTFVLLQFDRRVRRLEKRLRELYGMAPSKSWETVGGTGNVHRKRLGWRARAALWWACRK